MGIYSYTKERTLREETVLLTEIVYNLLLVMEKKGREFLLSLKFCLGQDT